MKAGVLVDGYVFPVWIQVRSSHTIGGGSSVERSNGEDAMSVTGCMSAKILIYCLRVFLHRFLFI